MGNQRATSIAAMFEASLASTILEGKKIPEEQRMSQAEPGKAHPTWQMGHLCVVNANAVMGMCLGKTPTYPQTYGPLFAPAFLGGQPAQSDPSVYPDWDEIMETYKAIGKEAVAAIKALDDSELDGPPKGQVPPPLQDRLKDLGSGLVAFALHNAYHTGQMNLLAALDTKVAAE